MLAAWRAEHGDWCPGWNRPGHPATDLTVDHDEALVEGGELLDADLFVLCRPCNSARGTG